MDNMDNVETGDNEDYLDNVESKGQPQRQPMRQPKRQPKIQPSGSQRFSQTSNIRHIIGYVTVVRRHEIHMFDEQLEQLVAK